MEITNKEIERIEKEGNPNEIWGVKSCKSYKSYLMKRIEQHRKKNNLEVVFILTHLLQAYEHFHKEKDSNYKLELEIINGWKGEGNLEVYRGFDNDFIIKEPIKDKETGDISYTTKQISKDDVNRMVRIIKNLDLNKKYTCYEIGERLGYKEWKDLWRERKVYFKIYYYPVKILEKLRMIKYSGRGDITRIK